MTEKMKKNGYGSERRRKLAENTATFGLLLICVALVAPFADAGNLSLLSVFKWVYGAGAAIFVIARAVGAADPADSMRIRRLRRMEFWAGVAFVIGAAFWFYTETRLGEHAGALAVMKNTIMFTLAGALIQIIASWMIVSRSRKENKEDR